MQTPKKDESIKTGFEREAHKITKSSAEKDAAMDTEIDADELVHGQNDMPEDIDNSDPDDLVHSLSMQPIEDEMEEHDPDDMVHEKGIEETEES